MILSRYPLSDQNGNADAVFRDEKTNQKIHRHLSDQNDVISEDDIKNVRTDIAETTEASTGQLNENNSNAADLPVENPELTTDGDAENGNQGRAVITPCDVLDA